MFFNCSLIKLRNALNPSIIVIGNGDASTTRKHKAYGNSVDQQYSFYYEVPP